MWRVTYSRFFANTSQKTEFLVVDLISMASPTTRLNSMFLLILGLRKKSSVSGPIQTLNMLRQNIIQHVQAITADQLHFLEHQAEARIKQYPIPHSADAD